MKEKIIKLAVFLGIFFTYKLLYAQAIRFNQLIVRDELIVQGTLKVNKLEGLKRDTIITKYLIVKNYLRSHRILRADTIYGPGLPQLGILAQGWYVAGPFTFGSQGFLSQGNVSFEGNAFFRKDVCISAGLFLPVGRKWGIDSVLVGNVKYRGTSFKVTGFTFIDTLGVDTLFIWMNGTWVNIKP
jgi:hypothetical protein